MPQADLTNVGTMPTRRRTRRRTRARQNNPIGSVRTGAGTGIGGGTNVGGGSLDFSNLTAREQRIASHFLEVGCRMYGNPVPSWLGKATR